MKYKDANRDLEDGATITRFFPEAEYDASLVTEALAVARDIREGRRSWDTYIDRKSSRPSWGAWDGRIDYRTGGPTLCGVEVTVPDGAGKKVAVMIRHNAKGVVPGNSGDPLGLIQEVVTYLRPWSWEEKLLFFSQDGVEEDCYIFFDEPRPATGWVRYYRDNPPGTESLVWYPTREDACNSVSDPDARAELLAGAEWSDQTPEGVSSDAKLAWGVYAVADVADRYFRGGQSDEGETAEGAQDKNAHAPTD